MGIAGLWCALIIFHATQYTHRSLKWYRNVKIIVFFKNVMYIIETLHRIATRHKLFFFLFFFCLGYANGMILPLLHV